MQHRNPIGAGPTIVERLLPEEIARRVFHALDTDTRQGIYEVVGPSAVDRVQRAIEYLREPIHMAQFQVQA